MLSSVLHCFVAAFSVLLLNLATTTATRGCHINGGNIIRRGKNLKLKTLERDDLATVTAIAAIAREGRGQMSGYADVLDADGDQLVAEWVLMQAQNAWTQG